MKTYEEIDNTNRKLKIEVFYSKGGINYYSHKTEPRGYWLSVRIVNLEIRANGLKIESFDLNNGVKLFLLQVKKQSEKSYLEACKLAELKREELKNHVLNIN